MAGRCVLPGARARADPDFRPTYRLETGRYRETVRTGLSLAIVASLVKASSGSTSTGHSSYGGARIEVNLPLAYALLVASSPPTVAASALEFGLPMARLITRNPNYYSEAERTVVEALAEQLSDDWAITHSTAWTADQRDGQHDGECDIVALGPTGLVAIEVKGGYISREGSRNFFSTNRWGKKYAIKNPVDQARNAKYILEKVIKRHTGNSHHVAHAIVFPDCSTKGMSQLGLDLEAGVLIDGDSLDEAGERIAALLHTDERRPMPDAEFQRICELLEPEWSLGGALGLEVTKISEVAAELTDEQHRIVQGLRANPRAVITGCAGSGKSIIALRHVAEAAESGRRVLYVCYNRLLAAHQLEVIKRASLREIPTVRTFHALIKEWLEKCGVDMGPEPASEDRMGWQEYLDRLQRLAFELVAVEEEFDAIVIDEGQDFQQSWVDHLELALADINESTFYMFLDPAQNIFWSGVPPTIDGAVFYDLTANCRTGDVLAKSIAKLLGDPVPMCGNEGGFPVEVIECVDETSADDELRKLLHRLVNEDAVSPCDIVVQTMARINRSRYRGKHFGNLRLVGREATTDPAPILKSNEVWIDTVHSLKGLETPVTIIVETEHIPEKHRSGLLRVGLTRAMTFAAWIKIVGGTA